MKFNHKIRAAMVAAAFVSTAAHAGIPVFDGANVAQSIIQVISWLTQLEDMATSVQTQANQLQGMTGHRMLGSIDNDPSLQKSVPDNAGAIYTSIASTGYSGLTPQAKSYRDASKLYNCEDTASDYQAICSASLNKNSQDMAYNQSAFTSASQRSAQIQTLMDQINGTTDQKSIDELNARIAAEGVAVANESNRLQIATQIQQTTERLNAQREKEWYLAAVQRQGALNGYVYSP